MSNKWAKREESAAAEENQAGIEEDTQPSTASESAAAGIEAVDLGAGDELSGLAAENAELKDHLLRALAETENVRRRSQKEKEDTARFAVTNFGRDMLNIADNLHRAIEAIPEEVLSEDHELHGLYQGVELVERDLQQALERHGITRIDAMGEKFDPNRHQAMFEVEDPSAEPGTVVQLLAPGYLINGRLLRPALVGVAKGGRKTDSGDATRGDETPAEGKGAHPSASAGRPPRR